MHQPVQWLGSSKITAMVNSTTMHSQTQILICIKCKNIKLTIDLNQFFSKIISYYDRNVKESSVFVLQLVNFSILLEKLFYNLIHRELFVCNFYKFKSFPYKIFPIQTIQNISFWKTSKSVKKYVQSQYEVFEIQHKSLFKWSTSWY